VQTGSVWVSVLNIRSGPGTAYSKVGRFDKNDSVSIIEVGQKNGWHKIWYENQIAYVYANYVEMANTPSIEATGVITASVLNIRTGPGTSHTIIGQLNKGDKVNITKVKYSSSWHQLLYDGEIVYVHVNYVNVDGAGADAQVLYATVDASALNFREGATTRSRVIDTLKRGDVVQLIEEGSAWHKVRYGGKEGYMYAKYLDVSTAVYGKVTTSYLNVRKGASTSYSIIGRLSKGDVVQIVSKGSKWYKIVYKSGVAYVYASYIDIQ
jgi:uncharacterized protein YgiM (DUF1202 family)